MSEYDLGSEKISKKSHQKKWGLRILFLANQIIRFAFLDIWAIARFAYFGALRFVHKRITRPLARVYYLTFKLKPRSILRFFYRFIVFILTIFLIFTLTYKLITHAPRLLKLEEWVKLSFYAEVLRDILWLGLQSVGALILLLGLLGIIIWLSGYKRGISVLRFENNSKNPVFDGRTVADGLIAELHRIHFIHHDYRLQEIDYVKTKDFGDLPVLLPSDDSLKSNLMEVGSVGVGENQLSVGRVLLAIQKVWPLGTPGQVITGSVHDVKGQNKIVVRIEDKEVRAWEVTKTIATNKDYAEMLEELAFKVAVHLNRDNHAINWRAYRRFTQATADFLDYMRTENNESISKAFENCKVALELEKDYIHAANLLCNIGRSLLQNKGLCEERLEMAKEAFYKVLEMGDSYDHSAYAFTGLGNYLRQKREEDEDALTAFEIAASKAPFSPYPYIGKGGFYHCRRDYEKALAEYKHAYHLNPHLFRVHYNLGMLYSRMEESEMSIRHLMCAKSILEGGVTTDSIHSHAIHNTLGWEYLKQDKFELAIQEMKESIFQKPKSYLNHGNLGIVYLKKYETKDGRQDPCLENTLEQSKDQLKEAVRLCENSNEAPKKLGYIFYQLVLNELDPLVSFSESSNLLSELDNYLESLGEQDRADLEDAIKDAEILADFPFPVKYYQDQPKFIRCYVSKCCACLGRLHDKNIKNKTEFYSRAKDYCGEYGSSSTKQGDKKRCKSCLVLPIATAENTS